LPPSMLPLADAIPLLSLFRFETIF
jgi:hypothetical protein